MLQLWIENDGRTAHLVNEAGGKVVSGALEPPEGTTDLVRSLDSGDAVRCPLVFVGQVI